MLDTVIGPKSDIEAIDQLLAQLVTLPLSGTVYVGYPLVVLPGGAAAIDVLLTCREHGVVVFDICRGAARLAEATLSTRQQELKHAVASTFASWERLTVAKRLIVEIRVLTLDPEALDSLQESLLPPASNSTEQEPIARKWGGGPRYSARLSTASTLQSSVTGHTNPSLPRTLLIGSTGFKTGGVANWRSVLDVLRSAPPVDAATLRYVNAAVQRLGRTRPVPSSFHRNKRGGPRAEALAAMDNRIANLDRWQKAAAIEMPEGPQRIRGLAGTGKTVVLALKAAYLHAREPRWRIVFTFYNRTLYEPLREIVRRFYHEQTKREPDWERLRLQHAWGSRERVGVYTEIAEHVGIPAIGVLGALRQFGHNRVFERVCRNAISAMGPNEPSPLYDAVLIDEAQDLPEAFLEMVYRVAAPPKRIVWAYDDLQSLDDYEPASPARLFGRDAAGRPCVPNLAHVEGDARRDIILPICYRNPPWALTTAHALGLGIYRNNPDGRPGSGLLQFYDDLESWREIGYEVEDGQLSTT